MNWRFRNEHREFLIAGWWLIWSLYCSCISVCTLLLLSRIRNPDTFVSFYADSCLCCIVWFVDKYIKEFRVVKVTRMMSGHDPKFWSSRIHSADWSSDFRHIVTRLPDPRCFHILFFFVIYFHAQSRCELYSALDVSSHLSRTKVLLGVSVFHRKEGQSRGIHRPNLEPGTSVNEGKV